jgi:hypothetical protein
MLVHVIVLHFATRFSDFGVMFECLSYYPTVQGNSKLPISQRKNLSMENNIRLGFVMSLLWTQNRTLIEKDKQYLWYHSKIQKKKQGITPYFSNY